MKQYWDVIVIGGGHAGCEAATASARLGAETLMVTLNPERIGFMSCNPAIGGLAKGQIVKEIDALGGVMALNTDQAAIQYRKLNSKKGPAVRSSRAQCDKLQYASEMQKRIFSTPKLTVLQGEVLDIQITGQKVQAIRLAPDHWISACSVVITSGTFLSAVMHVGEEQSKGGRVGDLSSEGLSAVLKNFGFRLRRLKTGTPPRLHQKSVDFSQCIIQAGDDLPEPFSFYFDGNKFPVQHQLNCFITYTNRKVHDIIEENVGRSPMFTGQIKGIGPRYCPSIEDKVVRFKDKERHQIFLEPEGWGVDDIYVNGVSTSLPRDVQEKFIRAIPGLERAEFIRYGYAVEYDAVDARQLKRTLESKDFGGLFFAGQINGTSGYEEAGGQGLVAGANAALFSQEKDPFLLDRSDGYIGVLIDDLITKGSDEPYRMFTSRCEYRLLHREDNADLRLSERAHDLGILDDQKFERFLQKKQILERKLGELKQFYFKPHPELDQWLSQEKGFPPLKDRISAVDLLKRPGMTYRDLQVIGFSEEFINPDIAEQIEIQVKYQGYIERDLRVWETIRKSDLMRVPMDINYDEIFGLSNEVKSKLRETRPETLGQASRIQGVTPAALANLMIYLRSRNMTQNEAAKYI